MLATEVHRWLISDCNGRCLVKVLFFEDSDDVITSGLKIKGFNEVKKVQGS